MESPNDKRRALGCERGDSFVNRKTQMRGSCFIGWAVQVNGSVIKCRNGESREGEREGEEKQVEACIIKGDLINRAEVRNDQEGGSVVADRKRQMSEQVNMVIYGRRMRGPTHAAEYLESRE